MFLCASCIQQIISIAYWHWQKRFSSKCISSFEPENVIQVSYSSPQQLFCYKVCCKLICIFCLLIVKNSRVCLNKQITMLSIQQFSHTLSVVQIYQYGYILLRYGESSVFCYSTCDNLNCPMWSVQNVIDLHWC